MIKRVKVLQDYGYMKIFYLWISIGIGFSLIYYIINFMFPQHGLLYFERPLSHELSDFVTIL